MNWLEKICMPQMDSSVPVISPQEAHDTCTGESFYHGSAPENVGVIEESGFSWEEGEARTEQTAHGYEDRDYHDGCPPPVHHLGYGIYLTAVRNIAKDYGYGSMKNVLEFKILKSARISEINWGATRTMTKWWTQNGYDCELANTDRVAATKALTDRLSAQYDAIYYKGKGLHRLLDGNQICVYNPSILRRVDKKLAQRGEIGSKVVRVKVIDNGIPTNVAPGMKGILLGRRAIDPEISAKYHNREPEFLTVKWTKGGVDMNVYPSEVEFL